MSQVTIVRYGNFAMNEEKQMILVDFVKYCARALELSKPCRVAFVFDKNRPKKMTSTGICEFSSRTAFIYSKNRSLIDLMRSISHELVHMKQHELNTIDLNQVIVHFASPYEDEANTIGARLMNAYADVVGYDSLMEGRV
jgi:hypothetical protein